MNTAHRSDPFRYTLIDPQHCLITITQINDSQISSKAAEAKLLEISKSGCTIGSGLNLYANDNNISLKLEVQLNEDLLEFQGSVRLQQTWEDSQFKYVIDLDIRESDKEKILIELRTLAAQRKIIVY
ncbi:hypothetical protein PASE110613_06720 [Paenibacillus sediminis]|uniref:PilZ domain-containing protein n=1 Tax=Paenibacillus sediminis TaxID=664909 RepID=A0ABS4H1X4_9BACL|nr:hypothetical protein [Paenibacillus sediminis]MBP1936476.1 hypothetical protein [Paenibacillus sediminis]